MRTCCGASAYRYVPPGRAPTFSGVRDAGRHPVFWTLSPGYLTMTDMVMVCIHGRNSGPPSLSLVSPCHVQGSGVQSSSRWLMRRCRSGTCTAALPTT